MPETAEALLAREVPEGEAIEPWREAWRRIADRSSLESLVSLRDALVRDDPRLLQSQTVRPLPIVGYEEAPAAGCCLLGWLTAGPMYDRGETPVVGYVNDGFELTRRLFPHDPVHFAMLIAAWDDRPREEARRLLLGEVGRSIGLREGSHDHAEEFVPAEP